LLAVVYQTGDAICDSISQFRRCETNGSLYKNVGLDTYRTSYVSKTQGYKWIQKFTNRVQIVEDSSQPGKSHCIIKREITAVVDDLIQENHFITISEIAMEMKLLSVLHTPLL